MIEYVLLSSIISLCFAFYLARSVMREDEGTSGPSINKLIELMSMVSIVFAAFTVSFSLL